jgi:replication-associated recombination protein RarA
MSHLIDFAKNIKKTLNTRRHKQVGMQTTILAQEDALQICEQAIKRPTHLFFYGFHGLGKTTLAFDFFDSYAKANGIEPRDPDYFMFLTADQDRGRFC